jgi:hypothetical protein
MPLAPGQAAEVERVVTRELAANVLGNPGVTVLATEAPRRHPARDDSAGPGRCCARPTGAAKGRGAGRTS